ncbi:sensor histidine kinase KdpD [Paenibacillus sp. FJAT-26967]|uniref:sensor histidine kinase n=1 Tax=Paenibacillus sp. FJAT-26967 TaxID=1729690 RepID=UPI0008393BB3|nr:ATP-binding protein [Paenibacillus sp. FJAT-26967]
MIGAGVWALIVLAAVSVLFNLLQFQSKRKRDAGLVYISGKVRTILDSHSSEKVLHLTDDRELKLLLAELNALLEDNHAIHAEYARSENAMRRMLSNISHDLKTPLTVVLGYIETIRQNPQMDDTERNRLLANVHGKALEVVGLMNKFFDLARLESGDKELPLTRVDLVEVCSNAILAFYDVITAKGMEVRIELPQTPVYVAGNEEALTRILNNLLSNAVQYGSDGGVIGLKVRQDEERAYAEVWDRGKGITELHKDRVFERMYTLEDSRNVLYQGSGLGLTITKRLVQIMGGEITLYSKPYEKTVFTVRLSKFTVVTA